MVELQEGSRGPSEHDHEHSTLERHSRAKVSEARRQLSGESEAEQTALAEDLLEHGREALVQFAL